MSSRLYIPHHRPRLTGGDISLPPSKSIAARMLILRAVEGQPAGLEGYDVATLPEDLHSLSMALSASLDSSCRVISVGESGTAMRFVLAYLCARSCRGVVRLEGTGRQHQRPIAPLVEALRSLGAHIEYLQEQGYPPLLIHPARLHARSIVLDASDSSQYLSALMLIAPLIVGDGKYEIALLGGRLASAPYVEITRQCMDALGYHWQQSDGVFSYTSKVVEQVSEESSVLVEGDWTAASYAYLLSALSRDVEPLGSASSLYLPGLSLPSSQGDSQMMIDVAGRLGIETNRTADGIQLVCHTGHPLPSHMELDCYGTPDLVPTLVAMLLALGVPFVLNGVAHLRLKESDRLMALAQECAKIGFDLVVAQDSLSCNGTRREYDGDRPISLVTYGDHRIAMALAPLMGALHCGGVYVLDPDVVNKSFPSYWSMLSRLGYRIETTKT